MPTTTYFNGNQGFYDIFGLWAYSVGALSNSNTTRTLTFDEDQAGEPLDPTARPAAIRFTFATPTVETATNGPMAGEAILTGGTLTGVTLLNDDGATMMTITGLSVDAGLVDTYIRAGEGWGLLQLLYGDGMTIVGSNSSTGPDNDWDGDDITTGFGKDIVNANGGDDYIKDQGGADVYNGGQGFDVISYDETFFNPFAGRKGIVANLAKNTVTGADGLKDKLISIEGVKGTHLRDLLIGSSGDNELNGMGGNDTLDGGAGNDWANYQNDDKTNMGGGNFGVVVTLGEGTAAGTARDGFGGRDVLKNIENVRGTDLDDAITGNSLGNQLRGDGGDDTLTGGAGNDSMQGGDGADQFNFSGSFGQDYIDDFAVGEDVLSVTGVDGTEDFTLEDQGDGVMVFLTGTANVSIFLNGLTSDDVGDGTILFGLL